jgi:hypothetical protein
VRIVVLLASATLFSIAACSSDPPASTNGQYCATVSANLEQINTPAIVNAADVESTANLYRTITSMAPLAVQKEWQTMTSNIEAAAAVDASDPASVQRVADMTRSSQQAAFAISDYTSKLCGVTLGTPTTTLPPIETSVPTT